MKTILSILSIALTATAFSVQAGMFKCQDPGGRISYQEAPCAEGAKKMEANIGSGSRPKSNLPCTLANIAKADGKFGTYLRITAVSAISAVRAGGSPEQQVSQLRKASAEAGSIAVPECMEPGREVLQKFLALQSERLSASLKGVAFQSGDTRSANLRAEYDAALEAAKRRAQEPTNVWAKP